MARFHPPHPCHSYQPYCQCSPCSLSRLAGASPSGQGFPSPGFVAATLRAAAAAARGRPRGHAAATTGKRYMLRLCPSRGATRRCGSERPVPRAPLGIPAPPRHAAHGRWKAASLESPHCRARNPPSPHSACLSRFARAALAPRGAPADCSKPPVYGGAPIQAPCHPPMHPRSLNR